MEVRSDRTPQRTGPFKALPGADTRVVSYLRLSVTDRCNLRCVYCMPESGIRILPHQEILTFDEIEGILDAVAGPLGLRGIRVTGGEPLVRGGIADLVRRLARLPGVDDLSMTTNALLLPRMARELREAGLLRVNVSLDTLRPERYRRICRGGDPEQVFAGIEAAEAAGLEPVKINMVVIPGINDDEIEEMARLTIERPRHVRFIEFMPVGNSELQRERSYIPSAELRARIADRFGLEEVARCAAGTRSGALLAHPGRGRDGRVHQPALAALLRQLQPHPPHRGRLGAHLPVDRPHRRRREDALPCRRARRGARRAVSRGDPAQAPFARSGARGQREREVHPHHVPDRRLERRPLKRACPHCGRG